MKKFNLLGFLNPGRDPLKPERDIVPAEKIPEPEATELPPQQKEKHEQVAKEIQEIFAKHGIKNFCVGVGLDVEGNNKAMDASVLLGGTDIKVVYLLNLQAQYYKKSVEERMSKPQ